MLNKLRIISFVPMMCLGGCPLIYRVLMLRSMVFLGILCLLSVYGGYGSGEIPLSLIVILTTLSSHRILF